MYTSYISREIYTRLLLHCVYELFDVIVTLPPSAPLHLDYIAQ